MNTQLTANPTAAVVSPSAEASPQTILGLPMQEMIDSIRTTIEIATRQGVAQARIELQPEELGHISIRISQTSEGLRARVSADTVAGAQALTEGRSELRQTLSSLGLSLLQLDIGSSGQSQTNKDDERSTERSERSKPTTTIASGGESEALNEQGALTSPTGVALGAIVDVLA